VTELRAASAAGCTVAVMDGATTTDQPCIVLSESKRLPCDLCGHPMEPEHAHYKCPNCSYILPCCGW